MKVVVLRGTVEQLAAMGMEGLVDGFHLIIENPGPERVLDQFGQVYDIKRFVVDSPEKALIQCMQHIKRAWEIRGKEAHLGHAVAGTWFFYWFSPDLERMETLVEEGRVVELRAAAQDYIDADFGSERGPTIRHQEDTDGSEHPDRLISH